MSLDQVDGDLDFVIDMLQTFCVGAQEQLESCSRAARVCDIATLRSEAHSMKGGAAACCATQLTNSCGALERMACLEQDAMSAKADTSAASSSSKSPENWRLMVDNIRECLETLSHSVDALALMRTLPFFSMLKDVNDDYAVEALSDMLQAAVNAYVAVHAAILKDEECNVSEERFNVAREMLNLACAAATALSVEPLVRTMGSLWKHLETRRLSQCGDTVITRGNDNVCRVRAEFELDNMRVTVESLAAQLVLILGERMPILAVPLVADEPESAVEAWAQKVAEIESIAVANNGLFVSSDGTSDAICDYNALMQNTGDDHKFVVALLNSFKDSLTIFDNGLADWKCSLFDAGSLHGAAVSMCVPRIVAALSNFMVATKAAQHFETVTDITDGLGVAALNDSAVRVSIREFRAATYQLARSLHALENGELSYRATMQRCTSALF